MESQGIKRYKLLQLAKDIGISAACKEIGVSRTTFYKWENRFREDNLQSLENLPPIHKNHPYAKPKSLIKEIVQISLAHPEWGCRKISAYLKEQGCLVSSPTTQKILIKEGMSSQYKRARKLEEKHISEGIKLSPHQEAIVEKFNPFFNSQNYLAHYPGEHLFYFNLSLRGISGIGTVRLHLAIDLYSLYMFAGVSKGNSLNHYALTCVLTMLSAINYFQSWEITCSNIIFSKNRELYLLKKSLNRHEDYSINYLSKLILKSINEEGDLVRSNNLSRIVKKTNITILNEFLPLVREKSFNNLDELQEELKNWLKNYNEKNHISYPNLDRSPLDMIKSHIKSVNREG